MLTFPSICHNSECSNHCFYTECMHTTLVRQLGSVMCHHMSWSQALRGFFLALQSPGFEIGAELTPRTNKETSMTLWNVGGPRSPKNVVSHQGFRTVLPNRMLTMATLNTGVCKYSSAKIGSQPRLILFSPSTMRASQVLLGWGLRQAGWPTREG